MRPYLDLVRKVIVCGESHPDRTGVGTISLFGTQTRYDLREGFPLMTTKRVNFGAVVRELLWFLRGSTNVAQLHPCKIWDPWADEDGELGPIYGYQWRNWGGTGIDQIQQAIDTIKNDPMSRRNIVSAWNVADLPKMRLPPCHAMFQFYVHEQALDCQLYQRSADLVIGVPFNIASYALLLSMIAKECGLYPRYFVHSIGDAHVYNNHLDGLLDQLGRDPRPLPELVLRKDRVDDFTVDDIELVGYDPHPAIKFEVAI